LSAGQSDPDADSEAEGDPKGGTRAKGPPRGGGLPRGVALKEGNLARGLALPLE